MPTCGDGVVNGSEQCDDGNLFDLDGCDSTCNYEVVTRMTAFTLSPAAGPGFCVHTGNALWSRAFTALALGQLNPSFTTAAGNGSLNIMSQFLGLSDPTGTSANGFSIGMLSAVVDPAKGAWTGATAPLDWWFLADPTTISMGLPTGALTNGALVSHALTAGPSTATFPWPTSPTNYVQMNNAKLVATIGGTTSTPAPPPTNLVGNFAVFETITANGAGQGLCGDVTVASLAQVPIPVTLVTGGATACTPAYTACPGNQVTATCNSWLDLVVSGCKTTGGLVTVVNATQPDVPGNGGAITVLHAGAMNKVTVPAGDGDAYSSYQTFTANRAHFTGESCASTAQCQTGQTCPAAGVCTPQ
jgi:cysteine-rich repeat protein